jgi:hypothetical protein
VLGLDDGILGMIMVIHTFGDYARFHPHLHAIVADGLFRPGGTFYCFPKTELKELEEILRQAQDMPSAQRSWPCSRLKAK